MNKLLNTFGVIIFTLPLTFLPLVVVGESVYRNTLTGQEKVCYELKDQGTWRNEPITIECLEPYLDQLNHN